MIRFRPILSSNVGLFRHLLPGTQQSSERWSTAHLSRRNMSSSSSPPPPASPTAPSAENLRAVIFDMGGVLLPSPFPAIVQLEDSKGLPTGSINRSIVESGEDGAFARLERGELCVDDEEFNAAFAADFVRSAGSETTVSLSGREFVHTLTSGMVATGPLPAAMDALRCLRAEGVRTAALTNNYKTRDGETGMPFGDDLFDVIVESCKEGVRKPSAQAYRLVLERLDLLPSQVVFLDDIGRNCKAAAALGIHSIRVSRLSHALSQLETIVGFPLSGYVSGTKAALGKHALAADSLTTYLRQALTISQRMPLNIRKFSHGQSNPTYFVGVGAKKFVLRKKPPGKLLPSAHAIEREYQVTEALYKFGVPVSKPLVLCEDSSIIGTPFYMMQYVEGRLLKKPLLPGLEPKERTAIYRSMCEALAKLHNVVPADAGLSAYGKEGNYLERQIKRWSSQYRSSETHTVEAMDRLIGWLPQNMPTDEVPSRIVHGDFRLDNLILERNSPTVSAILDWELSTLGDPLSDLAYHCMPYHVDSSIPMLGGVEGSDLPSLGIPTEEEYIAWYCQHRGLQHNSIPHWNFYLAFSFFRVAAIVQGVYKRALSGQGSSDNGKMAGVLVEYMAQRGLQLRSTTAGTTSKL